MKDDRFTKVFKDGVKQGLFLHAHWKDGVQMVGTTGKTLKEAQEGVDSGAYKLMLLYPENCYEMPKEVI